MGANTQPYSQVYREANFVITVKVKHMKAITACGYFSFS